MAIASCSYKQAHNASHKERLQMLWWLKSGQVKQHQELSRRLGRNGSTISHWLQKYRHGGLAALLEIKSALGRPPESGDALKKLLERSCISLKVSEAMARLCNG